MNQYPNGPQPPSNSEHSQETGQGYANGYQPQQFQSPGYPPPQAVPPQYPPQPQMGYPQQMMPQYPQQPMMQPQMMMPQMNVNVNIGNQRPQQISMLVRMIYFVFVGWWLGMFCLGVALSLCCSIIGLPIGLMILNRLGAIMTLSRR
jgi:hypothetical protein